MLRGNNFLSLSFHGSFPGKKTSELRSSSSKNLMAKRKLEILMSHSMLVHSCFGGIPCKIFILEAFKLYDKSF